MMARMYSGEWLATLMTFSCWHAAAFVLVSERAANARWEGVS